MAARKKGKGKGLTPNKARTMLHEHKFSSAKQQRFLGAKSKGTTLRFGKKGKRGKKR